MSEFKPTGLDEKNQIKLKTPDSLDTSQQNGELKRSTDSQGPTRELTLNDHQTNINGRSELPLPIDIGLAPNYQILELLGQGGMGTVYKVFDTALNAVFAIKVLRPELAQETATIKRFQQEANAVSKLTHPNLAAVYDQGITTSGAPYLVMGFIDGQGLDQILRQSHQLDSIRAIELFIQICESVQYAHEHGIVHRDLKPSNILVTGKGVAHIVDFGIAKILPTNHSRETQNLTNTGEVFGSPSYMSPEQGMGYNLEARSDIYSLGCVMYEVLSGRVPFEAANPIQTIVQHLSEKPAPLKSKIFGQKGVSKALELIIFKCLEKDPADRYQSMRDLQSDLQKLQDGKKVSARASKEEPLLNRSRVAKIAVVILLNLFLLGQIVSQYDHSMAQKLRAKALISSANALSKLFYDAGVAVGGYSITKSPLFADRYNRIKAQVPTEVEELKQLYQNNGSPIIQQIEQDETNGLKILDEAKQAIDGDKVDAQQFRARHMYKEIRSIADHLQANLAILTRPSVELATDRRYEIKWRTFLVFEILGLFAINVLATIFLMHDVQRAAKKRLWKIRDENRK